MPTIEKVKQTYNGVEIECAHLIVPDKEEIFRFTDVFNTTSEYNMEDDYAWQMVAKADKPNKQINLLVGGQNTNFILTNDFVRYTYVFYGVKPSTYPYVEITFPIGEYWLYHVQLEHGNAVTDWHPHPDDGVDIAVAKATENINTQIKNWVTFYDSEFEKRDDQISMAVRRITANTNNLAELKESTESRFTIEADKIESEISSVRTDYKDYVDGEIESVSKNITDITETATGIATKVQSITTYLGGDSEISESNFEQTANNISLKVASNVINDLTGETNLLKNTGSYYSWGKHSSVSIVKDSDGSSMASFSGTNSLSWGRYIESSPLLLYTLIRNKKVTLSLYVKSNDANAIKALTEANNGLHFEIDLYPNSSSKAGSEFVYNTFNRPTGYKDIDTIWKRISFTADISDSWFTDDEAILQQITNETCFTVRVYNYTLYKVDVKKIQLELGEEVTAWNDKVNVNDYSSNNLVSMINMSSNKIEMSALNIDLSGYVTFTNLSNSQSGTNQTTIDGSHISTGLISDGGVGKSASNYWDLRNGEFQTQKGKIANFTIAKNSISTGNYNDDDVLYFGSSGLKISNAFKVSSSGAAEATNLSVQGGVISIKDQDGNQVFYASSSGAVMSGRVHITEGTINLNDGVFYVDSYGNVTAKSIRITDSKGNNMLSIDDNETGDKTKFDGKTLIAETLLAKNISIKDGVVNIESKDHTADGYKNYITLKYGWKYDGDEFLRTTNLTSSGLTITLDNQHNANEKREVNILDSGLRVFYHDQMASKGSRGVVANYDTLGAFYNMTQGNEKPVFVAYTDIWQDEDRAGHAGQVMIGNSGGNGFLESRTQLYGAVYFQRESNTTFSGTVNFLNPTNINISAVNDTTLSLPNYILNYVDNSNHTFTRTNLFTYKNNDKSYNLMYISGVEHSSAVYAGSKNANIVFGAGQEGIDFGVRFMDSVTLPNPEPNGNNYKGTRIINPSTGNIVTLGEYITSVVEDSGGGSGGSSTNWNEYLSVLSSTEPNSGATVNLKSGSTRYGGDNIENVFSKLTGGNTFTGNQDFNNSSSTTNYVAINTSSLYIPWYTRYRVKDNNGNITDTLLQDYYARLSASNTFSSSNIFNGTVTLNGNVNVGNKTLAQYIQDNAPSGGGSIDTSNLAKLNTSSSQTFTGANTFSGTVTLNGNLSLGSLAISVIRSSIYVFQTKQYVINVTGATINVWYARYGGICTMSFYATVSATETISTSYTFSSDVTPPALKSGCGLSGYNASGMLELSGRALQIRIYTSASGTKYLRGNMAYCVA